MKNSLDVCKDNIIMSISLEDKSWTFCILSNTLVSTYPYLTTSAETNVLKPSPIKLTKLTLGFPKRNLIHGPPRTKETAYKALVRSTLEYCSSVWDPPTAKNTHGCARWVLNRCDRKVSVTEMLSTLK